jgi:DNA-binding Lrp family transcriptional regulator
VARGAQLRYITIRTLGDRQMKLTEKESRVLAAIELRADAPMELLRKETGFRDHTIRYALRSLIERDIISPVPFVNLHRLGLTIYSIFFTVGGEKRASHDALIRTLLADPMVLWVGEFGGEYHYSVGIAVNRLGELTVLLDKLSQKHGAIFRDKAISVQISSTVFPRRYLTSRKTTAKPIRVTFDARDPFILDSLDRRILIALTSKGTLSHRQIALLIQAPLSTVELRIKKLRGNGVISGQIYSVDASKFAMHSFKLLVYTGTLDVALTAKITGFCNTNPHITTLIACLGTWGYEINVEVHNPEEISQIVQQMYQLFGNSIQTIRTLTKFRYPKVRFFPDDTSSVDRSGRIESD